MRLSISNSADRSPRGDLAGLVVVRFVETAGHTDFGHGGAGLGRVQRVLEVSVGRIPGQAVAAEWGVVIDVQDRLGGGGDRRGAFSKQNDQTQADDVGSHVGVLVCGPDG